MRVPPPWWNWWPYKGVKRLQFPPHPHSSLSASNMRIQPEDSHLQTKKRAQTPNMPAPWSWTFQPPELWRMNVYCLSHTIPGIHCSSPSWVGVGPTVPWAGTLVDGAPFVWDIACVMAEGSGRMAKHAMTLKISVYRDMCLLHWHFLDQSMSQT